LLNKRDGAEPSSESYAEAQQEKPSILRTDLGLLKCGGLQLIPETPVACSTEAMTNDG
jgi:hypothetical protein